MSVVGGPIAIVTVERYDASGGMARSGSRQTSFVATSSSLSRIPLPTVTEMMPATASAPLFPPQPSLMSQQIQQQTEVAQQVRAQVRSSVKVFCIVKANLQAIDEQRISQVERQENKLDADMGQLVTRLAASRAAFNCCFRRAPLWIFPRGTSRRSKELSLRACDRMLWI